ncbi:Acyl-CoA desaturase [Penicillium rolfsii]|nr:Acyl-CoA desaturase [Penicillium rolfsii]
MLIAVNVKTFILRYPTERKGRSQHLFCHGSIKMSKPVSGPVTRAKPLWKRLHWRFTAAQIGYPLFVAYSVRFVPFLPATQLFTLLYTFITGLTITAGYHRLWTHRAYRAHIVLRILLASIGAGALQLPIRTWARDHRAHHRFVDTDRDPYNSRRGLFYSHIGWILTYDSKSYGRGIDVSDLDADPVVVWQRRIYYPLAAVTGFLLPAAVAGLGWGDWRGGFLYVGALRVVVTWHTSFCINSLAHWGGSQRYADSSTARNNVFTALFTLGEGYHNFHHVFPADYRNGVRWYELDPTKWWIWVFERLGLAWELRRFSGAEIEKICVQQMERDTRQLRVRLDWGKELSEVPVLHWDEYVEACQNGKPWVVVNGVVHDVGEFCSQHPGGEQLLLSSVGKDATEWFSGGVYNHSQVAINILSTLRVGAIYGGGKIEGLQ